MGRFFWDTLYVQNFVVFSMLSLAKISVLIKLVFFSNLSKFIRFSNQLCKFSQLKKTSLLSKNILTVCSHITQSLFTTCSNTCSLWILFNSLVALSSKWFTQFWVNCNFDNWVNHLELSESSFFICEFEDEDDQLDSCNYSQICTKTYRFWKNISFLGTFQDFGKN